MEYGIWNIMKKKNGVVGAGEAGRGEDKNLN